MEKILLVVLFLITGGLSVYYYITISAMKKENEDLSSSLGEAKAELRRLKAENKNISEMLAKKEEASEDIEDILTYLPEGIRKLMEEHSYHEKATCLLNLVTRLFSAEDINIYTADKAGKNLYIMKSSSPLVEQTEAVHSTESGYLGWVCKKRNPVDDTDLENESNLIRKELSEATDKPIILGTTIRYEERLLGVISIGKLKRRRSYDKKLLALISRIASISVINAELIKEIKNPKDIDDHTGLFNESYIMRRIEDEINRSQRFKIPFSVMVFYLDDYDDYRKQFGEDEGWRLLRHFASLIPAFFRATDIIACTQQNHFIVLLTGSTKEDVEKFREKLLLNIEDMIYPHQEEWKKPLTIYGGIAEYPSEGESTQALVETGVGLVEAAKYKGKKGIIFPDESSIEH